MTDKHLCRLIEQQQNVNINEDHSFRALSSDHLIYEGQGTQYTFL